MRADQPTKCFTTSKTSLITDRSEAVVLLWFSVACVQFGVRVSVTFHVMCVHIILVRFGC